MSEPTLLLRALSVVYRSGRITRGAGRLLDSIPVRLLGGHEVWIQTPGGTLLVRTRDSGGRDLLLRRQVSHEREESRIVRILLPAVRGFLDVGASYGWYTGLASSLMPTSSLALAVEANPDVFACLKRSVSLMPRTTAVHATATAVSGTATFHCARASNLSSAVRPVGQAFTVPAATLDELWPNDCPLDLVKCDVEGGELECLVGARRLRNTWQPIWLLEFDEAMLREAGHDPGEVAAEVHGVKCLYRSEKGWSFTDSLLNVIDRPRPLKNVFLVPLPRLNWFVSALHPANTLNRLAAT
jgi:FkbM family methyltransferase